MQWHFSCATHTLVHYFYLVDKLRFLYKCHTWSHCVNCPKDLSDYGLCAWRSKCLFIHAKWHH